MSTVTLTITNKQARLLWLATQGLGTAPCGKRHTAAFADRVQALGMVQLDSIGVLARAHHHILWSRQSAYRPTAYDQLLQKQRAVFEHFSHDAVILPMSTYPYWQRQHQRCAQRYQRSGWGKEMANVKIQRQIIDYIERNGAVCSRDFSEQQQGPVDRSTHAWMRPPHKLALDYLWLNGTLSVSHRKNFIKYYDLSERIIPPKLRNRKLTTRMQVNWLCESAVQRMGFANAREIQRFWDACDLTEVKTWLTKPSIPIMPIDYLDYQGNTVSAYASVDIESTLTTLARPTQRIRIISPFDPAIRDRDRLKRLFGFDYRIEIYTPAAKRRYGYYVYPMLEGDRLIGRIDVRANRQTDSLDVRAWWLETSVKPSTMRQEKITSELQRLAKLAGVTHVGALPRVSANPDSSFV